MPLAAEDFVQENWGTTSRPAGSTSVDVPLTGGNNPGGIGTTAGNTVLIVITSQVGLTTPSGFSADKSINGTLLAYSRSDIPAGETSWTFTYGSAGATIAFSWYVVELSNVDPAVPLEVSATGSDSTMANGDTLASGTTPQSAALDTVVFAAFEVQQAAGSETQSWSGYTNEFEELVDFAPDAAGAWQLAVARKFVTGATGQFSTTATLATSAATTSAHALIVAYRAVGSPITTPLTHFVGFEWGTHGGINSHGGITNMLGSLITNVSGTWGTNWLIQAASARNSNYGLRIVQSGAAAYVQIGNLNGMPGCAFGLDLRVVSATGTVVVASLGTYVYILYDSSASKFGVRVGSSGTVSWQSGTTALNTFAWIAVRLKLTSSTRRAEWSIEEAGVVTEQNPAELSGQTITTLANATLQAGASTAQTMTADYDNVCLSAYYAAWPLGPYEVRLLVPDTAATVTYSGTPGNFAIVASNATSTALAGSAGAITTTGVAGRLDEVPPTVSAAADGVVQTATAASDYLQFPMADPVVADDEVIDGVRMLAALISTTGAGAGNLDIRSWDGTTETVLGAVAALTPGAPTAFSATAPRWLTAMWPMANGWTEARLAAAALRVGFSGDATPDMGAEVLYLEYATRKAKTIPVFGGTDPLRVEQQTNPNTGGIRALYAYTPAGQTATLTYEVNGTPTSVSVPANSNPLVEVIDAPDLPTVNRIELIPDG